MNTPNTPERAVELLASVVESARRARFWRLTFGDCPVTSLDDFKRLPIVSTAEYRRQRFSDLLTDPAKIDWIPGPWLGQSPDRAPVAEGATEARLRVRIMRQALSHAVPDETQDSTALVASTFDNRYFGAEMCAVFVRMGIPAHLVTDSGTGRLADLVNIFEPDIIAVLSDRLDIENLPRSVRGVITVGASARLSGVRHADLYVCNELGVLGVSIGGGDYRLFHDAFHFETSPNGTLVVTPYFSHVQPVVRLDTGERIRATLRPDMC